MASNYPGAVDAFDTIAADKKMSDAVGGRTHRAILNDLGDAIEAVQTELGTDPAGIYDTVATRLAAIDDRVLDATISDVDIAADADIDRSKIAGTALTTSSTGVFSVLDYGADPTGVADSTAEIQAAIDAAHAAGGGTVMLPQGTFKITGDGLFAKSASIVGAGARSDYLTPLGTVLQGSAQTGPVLSAVGEADSYTGMFLGIRTFEGFTISGDGINAEQGLHLENTHNLRLKDLVIRDNVGVPFYAEHAYFVTVDNVLIGNPIDVATNDTFWVELRHCNSWRTRNILLSAFYSDVGPHVGASGAVFIGNLTSAESEMNDFHFVVEGQRVPEGSVGIVDHRGSMNKIQVDVWDLFDYGTVTTPWSVVTLRPTGEGDDYGGNVVVGQSTLIAHWPDRLPAVGELQYDITAYGVTIEQDNNAVVAVPGYIDKTVYLADGVKNCHIDLIGSYFEPSADHVVDDSGETSNFISNNVSVQFPQTQMGFFGTAPVAKPAVSGRQLGYAAQAQALAALDVLGLVTDTSVPVNLLTAWQASIEDSSCAGWVIGEGCTIAQSAEQYLVGTHSLKITATGGFWQIKEDTSRAIHTVTPGDEITALASVYRPAASTGIHEAYLWIAFYSAAGALISSPVAIFNNLANDVWTPMVNKQTVPAGTAYCAMMFGGASAAGNIAYVDKLSIHFGDSTEWATGKPVVVGSRGGNAALENLMAVLSELGIVGNETS